MIMEECGVLTNKPIKSLKQINLQIKNKIVKQSIQIACGGMTPESKHVKTGSEKVISGNLSRLIVGIISKVVLKSIFYFTSKSRILKISILVMCDMCDSNNIVTCGLTKGTSG